jgi:hypothetical protein
LLGGPRRGDGCSAPRDEDDNEPHATGHGMREKFGLVLCRMIGG